MKVKCLILAGGFGTRLSEYTEKIPKPLVEIGGRPILSHIIDIYASQGVNDFVILAGYKSDKIKSYFLEKLSCERDLTIDYDSGEIRYLNDSSTKLKITVLDTGLHTMTGGRVRRALMTFKDPKFFLTYGDGLSNVNLRDLMKTHESNGAVATLTAVRPPARYGELHIENSIVKEFKEKPKLDSARINGGFFVINREILDHISDDECIFEREPLEVLADRGLLSAYQHDGFWQSLSKI